MLNLLNGSEEDSTAELPRSKSELTSNISLYNSSAKLRLSLVDLRDSTSDNMLSYETFELMHLDSDM